jgi:hypothetical protein
MSKYIKLINSSDQVLVDDFVYHYLNSFAWGKFSGYAYCGQLRMSMHRFLLGLEKYDGKITDHINRDKLDNRLNNLRVGTQSENSANIESKANSSSKYLGVNKVSGLSKPWKAQIHKNKKKYYIGYFKTEREAAKAYDAKAKELHGEYANLNF